MVDGGTEGFKGHARVIVPGCTPCFECTIWLFPPQVKFPLCTLAETPRTAAHCIEYAHLIKWDEVHSGKTFDPDKPEHMHWVYSEVDKNSICSFFYFSLSIASLLMLPCPVGCQESGAFWHSRSYIFSDPGCCKKYYTCHSFHQCKYISCMRPRNLEDCLWMQQNIVQLFDFIGLLEEHPKLLLSRASITHRGKNLYMQAPPVLEEMTRSNLDLSLFELMDKIPKDIVHVTGTKSKSDKKTSSSMKLHVIFKGVDGVADMDTAGGS